MIIRKDDIDISARFFTTNPEEKLAPYAAEMNRKHPALPLAMKALEHTGTSGYIVDELMLGIVIIWYVIEKMNYKRIDQITEADIVKNGELFQSFIKYFNESDDEEKYYLNYFPKEKDLAIYVASLFKRLYKIPENIPNDVSLIYFAIMKCFEDKLDYARRSNDD
jgi:hypothetical protein